LLQELMMLLAEALKRVRTGLLEPDVKDKLPFHCDPK
jgi:hypothetical protein